MPNGQMPPIPKQGALAAYVIVLPLVAVALLTSPIWLGAFGFLKLMRRIKAPIEGTAAILVILARICGLLLARQSPQLTIPAKSMPPLTSRRLRATVKRVLSRIGVARDLSSRPLKSAGAQRCCLRRSFVAPGSGWKNRCWMERGSDRRRGTQAHLEICCWPRWSSAFPKLCTQRA